MSNKSILAFLTNLLINLLTNGLAILFVYSLYILWHKYIKKFFDR